MAAASHLIVTWMGVSFSMNLISAFRHLSQTHATDIVNNFQENPFSVELENDDDYVGYRFKDPSDGVAPSGSREQATESPRDIVDSFLSKVEEYERNKENCTPGTTFNLGEGVVAQYGVRRFRRQAMAAVERANFLTRIWKNRTPEQGAPLDSDYFFYSAVRTMVEGDDDLFAAGNCYDFREYKNRTLWCAYAYRLPSNRVMVKDLSVEYKYLGNDSEFFYEARRKAAAKLERGYNVSIGYSMYRHNDTGHLDTTIEDSIVIEYEDGHWSKPYFDCKGGDIWMMTYTVPFFGFVNHTYYFKGTSGIDIDLQKVDIDQCDLPSNSLQLNVFAGTHKCKHPTTKCVPVDGLGFRRGSYRCVCQSGYYFPNTSLPKELRYFDGTDIEKQYDQMLQGKTNDYYLFYACLPCMPGCSTCVDGSPCVLSLDWILRGIVLALTCLVICFIPALVWLTYNFKHVKVIKAASPVLLRIVLLGAFLLYCPMIVQYFEPTAIHCSMRIWLRELGFSISYGALLLKTWRISVAFRIRSAQKIRISDVDLIKRLLIIVGVFAVFLMIRMIVAAPQVVRGTHSSGLHTFQCSWDSWDYCAAVAELGLLVWGVRLCIMVRKAPFEFNESRFISWAIYNETLLSLFLNITIVFLQSSSNPDLLYLVLFFYTQLTTTVTLAILFGSKIYFVYKSKMSKTGEQSTTSSNSTTKYLVVPKTDASRSSCIRLHEGQMNLDGEGEIQLDKDIQDELRRLYTQLELLRQRNMRMGNPHLNFKSSTVYHDKSKDLLRQTSEIALLSRDVSQSSSPLYKHYGTIGQDILSRDLNVTFSLRCDGKKDDHVIDNICTSL